MGYQPFPPPRPPANRRMHSACPGCGAPNSARLGVCAYCLRPAPCPGDDRPPAALLLAGVLSPNEARALRDDWRRACAGSSGGRYPVLQPAPTLK